MSLFLLSLLVAGCYTNCVGWQFVRVEKSGIGSCIFRKTAIYQLTAEKKDSMSDDRQTILSFFYQKPEGHGLVVSADHCVMRTACDIGFDQNSLRFVCVYLFGCACVGQGSIGMMLPIPSVSAAASAAASSASKPTSSKFTARQIATGGTCIVFACEPTTGARNSAEFIAVKQLIEKPGAKELLQHETEMMQKLNAMDGVKQYIPTFVFSRSAPQLELGMKPIGDVMRRRDLTKPLISSLIAYAVGLAKAGYADWDLRDLQHHAGKNTIHSQSAVRCCDQFYR